MSGGGGNILESVGKIGLGIVAPELAVPIALESAAESTVKGGSPIGGLLSAATGGMDGGALGDVAGTLSDAGAQAFMDTGALPEGFTSGMSNAGNFLTDTSTVPTTTGYENYVDTSGGGTTNEGGDAGVSDKTQVLQDQYTGQPNVDNTNPFAGGTPAENMPSKYLDNVTKTNADKGFWSSLNNWQKAGIVGAGGLGAYALLSADNKRFGTPSNAIPTSYIRPFSYSKTVNPQFGGVGQPYFSSQTMTPGTPVNAVGYGIPSGANGGIVAMADGGSTSKYTTPVNTPSQAVQDYNNMLAQRAQAEYVNQPQLGVMTPRSPQMVSAAQQAAVAQQQQAIAQQQAIQQAAAQQAAAQAAAQQTPVQQTPAPVTNYGSYDGGGAAKGGIMKAEKYAMGGGIGGYYPSPDDGTGGQHPTDTGIMGAHPSVSMGPAYPMQGTTNNYAKGGDVYNLGSYSDGGRLLKGPGDGVSDDIPAQIGKHQPARLADGEFVIPARIVSELGNGSTDAGAKRLYAMMNKVQQSRKKSIGKDKVAVDSKAYKHLPK